MKYIYDYIKINYNYYLIRKYEFLINILKNKFSIDIEKNKIGFLYFFKMISLSFNFFIIYIGLKFLTNTYKDHINSLFIIVAFLFSLIFLVKSFSISEKILQPVGKQILELSPLTNRNIILLIWFSNFILHESGQFLIFNLSLLYLSGYVYSFPTNFVIIFMMNAALILANISLTIFICKVNYTNIIKGFYLGSFIISFIKSVLFLLVSYFFSTFIINLISIFVDYSDSKKILSTNYFNILLINILDKISLSIDLVNTGVLLFLILALLAFSILHYKYSGIWLRKNWDLSFIGKDWLEYIYSFYSFFVKSPILLAQLRIFLNSREQLRNNYSYFFLHPTNFIFVGIAIAFKHSDIDSDFVNLLFTYIIINIFSKDAFSQIDLFPGILRFDSEKYAINIYRLSGVSLFDLYKSKVNLQRILGVPELIIMGVIYYSIFNPNYYIIIFGISLILYNIIITPHLNTISSYIFPHFKYQHFSELEEFVEDNLFVDKIGFQFKRAMILIYIFSILTLLFFDVPTNIIYLTLSVIFTSLIFIYIWIIKKILIKKTRKYEQGDINV